jgi:excisionase family DNA binding protein
MIERTTDDTATQAGDQLRPIYRSAERHGLNYFTLRSWLLRGLIPHVKVGRRYMVSDEAVQQFLDAHRVPARGAGR